MIAPTSDKALPRPARTQVNIENLASQRIIVILLIVLALNILNKSSYSLYNDSRFSVFIEIIIGKIITIWAITIIAGVYKISKNPNGPLFENKTYKIKPTKTGGNAIKELKKIFIIFFPTKLFVATKADIGSPNIIEKKRAMVETLSDKKIIS